MNRKPNILFFFTDDQRFDTIAALGNPQISTPNLDRLINSGTTFTRAHIPGGTCGAVCMPSRAMLHTGRTLFHIQGEGQEIPTDHTTLGECLRQAGYATYGIGKWHNGFASYTRSFSGGDEIFFGGMGDHWNVPACRFDPDGNYDHPSPIVRDPWTSNQVEYLNCDHITPGKHSTDLFKDAALRLLDRHPSNQPYFMYVSLMAPHDPRTMPKKFLDMYDPAEIELPANFLPEHPIDTGALRIRDEMLATFPRDPAEIQRHIAEYYAMISHLDDALGQLLQKLEQRGDLANTIIVVAGDNGLALGQHGLMGKQNLYDHSVRVPLIFAGPGIPSGAKHNALVYLSDIFPTLCELTGTEIPATVEGSSLKPCIDGITDAVRDSLYLAYADSIRGLTNGRHKLIEYACGATQLFDLQKDPNEINNLANNPAYTDTVATMRQRLTVLAQKWGDADHPAGKGFWEQARKRAPNAEW